MFPGTSDFDALNNSNLDDEDNDILEQAKINLSKLKQKKEILDVERTKLVLYHLIIWCVYIYIIL